VAYATFYGKQEGAFVLLRTMAPIWMASKPTIQRDATGVWPVGYCTALRSQLADGQPEVKEPGILAAAPVAYNQLCATYLLGESGAYSMNSGPNYCTPRCIAGCVPVAWAMLLSAYKRAGLPGSDQI
jgi:hypothetical protein